MTNERLFAINACKELETSLSLYGFKCYQKGLSYKRKLTKDITQEILFVIQRYNLIRVGISSHSRKMKQWNIDNQFSENGYLYDQTQFSYITPIQTYKTWEIALSDIAKKQFQKEVLFQIEKYVIPFLDKFRDMDVLINDLVMSGGQWSPYEKLSKLPMSVVLAFGSIEQAQLLLDNYCKRNPLIISNVKRKKIDQMTEYDFQFIEFLGADEFKLAFSKGLKLK